MKRFRTAAQGALLAISAFLMSNAAYAIGDSGGSGCGSPAIVAVAAWGTPHELASAIAARVEQLRNPYVAPPPKSWFWRLILKPKAAEPLEPSQETLRRVLNDPYHCYAPTGTRLLDYAAATGNLANVEYLLSRGVDPNAADPYDKSTIFSRCINVPEKYLDTVHTRNAERKRTPDEVAKMLAVFDFLLQNGASLDTPLRDGLTVLHLCDDPSAIEFFLKHGVNVDQKSRWGETALDVRAKQVAQDSYLPSRQQSFPIFKLLASATKNKSLSPDAEFIVCRRCSTEPSLGQYCQSLSGLLNARHKEIFKFHEERKKDEGLWRCRALSEPDCKDCYWRKYYSLERMESIPQSTDGK